jgi:hypothetical protein
MSEDIVKQINESKVQQELRESITTGKTFEAKDDLHQKVLNDYNQMDESQKEQFTQKGWKNG